jgi:hypothetical protein
MSDYFLNKIYDSLLANKTPKAKSTFRTLSESYNLVYEEEQQTTGQVAQIAFNVNEPVLTLIPWTPQQANLYRLTDKKGPEIETGEVIEG